MTKIQLGTFALAIVCSPLAAQWGQQSPATSPSARSGHGMCFDGTRVVLFGGSTGFSTSNQTWSYNGTTWSQLAPTASPSGKTGVELVNDPIRGVVVMYGSSNTSPFGGASVDQTWEFDGTTWTQVFPTTTPGGLGVYGACYDIARQRVVLYGGSANSFFPIAEAGTWEYNGTTWSLITTVGTPGPLERPAMCYHAGLAKSVLFGGIDPQVGGVDTTWLYDGTSWTAAAVTGPRPAVRTGARMTYDSVRGVCVLTGGLNPTTGAAIVDTWEFSGVAWTQVPTATTGRFATSSTFLPTMRQVVLFGGLNPATFADLGDTWHYGAKSSTFGTGCAGTAGVPALTAVDAPRIGSNFVLNLTNLVPTSPIALFVIGFSNTTGPLGTLPAMLDSFGMIGCFDYVSTDFNAFVSASAGSASLTTTIPNSVGFMGLTFFHQGVSFDPAANAGGATVSNAHRSVVGR